jgi:tetratricopeptide (TPR) repeat protein
MQQNLKTRQDSIDYCNKLKQIYEKDKSNEQIFGTLASILGNLGPNEKAEQKKLVSDKLAENPNNFMAWALKGQVEMNESKWDDAIASYKKAVSIDDKNALILTYLGFSINSKAATIENNKTEQMNLIKESMGYLEKARDADPNREKANWCYPLYQCYYAVYGANDSRTKEMEAMTKR